MATLRLDVLSPDKTILAVDEVAWVQVQLADGGGLGIYPGHAPLLAETIKAPLRYQDAQGEHSLILESGVLYVTPARVEIFIGAITEENMPPHADDITAATFDRLARELLSTLRTSPNDDAQ